MIKYILNYDEIFHEILSFFNIKRGIIINKTNFSDYHLTLIKL